LDIEWAAKGLAFEWPGKVRRIAREAMAPQFPK